MEVEEFAHEFLQDILTEADADGQFVEDVFFQQSCEFLGEAGELETADRVSYRLPARGVRVDGYGGDPIETSGILSLIILDFHPRTEIGRLTKTEMDAAFRRLENFLHRALDDRWRDSLEESSPAFGLADLIAKRWRRIAKLRFLLVSNRSLSERVDGRPAGEIHDRPVSYSVWDIRRLHMHASVSQVREDIEIVLDQDFGGPLPILSAQQPEADHESYLAVISGEMLARIYDRWGARLLEQNVRVFLQARGKVNRGIRVTLENEPSMFFAYNNGITATAEKVDIKTVGDRLLLHKLHNFQIVNGGQTTASLYNAKLRSQDLSQTFVQMKLSVVTPERASELVPKISEYANSQNRVNAADFFANHPFHVRIEGFSRRLYAPSPDGTFRQSKWFYERARGQYADARANLTPSERRKFDLENPRRQLFNKTDLAKFLGVWEERPHEVSRGAQKNFAAFAQRIGSSWNKSPDEFGEAWYRTAVAKAIVFRSAERIVSAQEWYQGGYRANIVAYSIAKISYDINQHRCAADFDLIWRKQALSSAFEEAIAVVAKHVCDVLTKPPLGISNVTEWAKKQPCWEQVRTLSIELPDAFGEELVSIEEHRETVRSARREQRELNGIEAQIAVVNAGSQFWSEALSWGKDRGLLSPTEREILEVASRGTKRTPTDKQSSRTIRIFERLKSEGFPSDLPASS